MATYCKHVRGDDPQPFLAPGDPPARELSGAGPGEKPDAREPLRVAAGQDRGAAHRSRPRDLCVAMLVARILEPRSKLATARALGAETLASSLGEVLGVADADAGG